MSNALDLVDIPNHALPIIELQQLLCSLSEENVEDICEQILSSGFSQGTTNKYELCCEIRLINRVRPASTYAFAKLIKILSERLPNYDLIRHIFEHGRTIYHADVILMQKLFTIGVIGEEFIINFHKKLVNRPLLFAFYFAPDIKYFDNYILSRRIAVENQFDGIFKNYQKYRENNFRLLREYVEYGWMTQTLGFYLKYDDVDSFIVQCAERSIELNSKTYSPFEYLIESATPLIDLAAVYGSSQIFKYLLESLSVLPKDIPKYAVIGGNYEIIRLCVQKGLDFSDALIPAVEYHRNEILNWLTMQGIAASTFYSSVMKDNLLALIYFCSQGFCVNFNEHEWSTPLHMAVSYGSTAVIDYLISSGCDSTAVDENGWTPIDLADSEYQKLFIGDCINNRVVLA